MDAFQDKGGLCGGLRHGSDTSRVAGADNRSHACVSAARVRLSTAPSGQGLRRGQKSVWLIMIHMWQPTPRRICTHVTIITEAIFAIRPRTGTSASLHLRYYSSSESVNVQSTSYLSSKAQCRRDCLLMIYLFRTPSFSGEC